jgi:hypothetical protein
MSVQNEITLENKSHTSQFLNPVNTSLSVQNEITLENKSNEPPTLRHTYTLT